jgi:hypothetical protein
MTIAKCQAKGLTKRVVCAIKLDPLVRSFPAAVPSGDTTGVGQYTCALLHHCLIVPLTVMFGATPAGRAGAATLAVPQTYFRAGHAHAGVLLLMSLLYHHYMEQTTLAPGIQVAGAVLVLAGILAQSGGFFLHMAVGQPGQASLGTAITTLGAVLLAGAVLLLVYGLIVSR